MSLLLLYSLHSCLPIIPIVFLFPPLQVEHRWANDFVDKTITQWWYTRAEWIMQNRNNTPSSTFPYLRPCYISISISMRASACQPKPAGDKQLPFFCRHHLSCLPLLCAQVLFLFRTSRHESIFVKRTTKPITIGHNSRGHRRRSRFNIINICIFIGDQVPLIGIGHTTSHRPKWHEE